MHDHATDEILDPVRGLAKDARNLIAATAEATGEHVQEARNRVASAVKHGKHFIGDVQHKVVNEAKSVDESARHHPYQAMGLAMGLGACLGVLLTKRR